MPAVPPTSASARIQRASQTGAAQNCNLSNGVAIAGGAMATDDTVALNAALATAAANAPVKLTLDGASAVSALVGPAGGHWAIEGTGEDSGIWLISGSNHQGISNSIVPKAAAFEPLTTAPTPAGTVELRRFRIEGNRGNGYTGTSNTGDARGYPLSTGNTPWYYCGIDLANLETVRLEDLAVNNSPLYAIRLNNCKYIFARGLKVISPAKLNCDGLHIDGPTTAVNVSGCMFSCPGDDAIALNANEGYGGNIGGAAISDITILAGLSGIRVLSGSYLIGPVVLSNWRGAVTNEVLLVGNTVGSAIDCMQSVQSTNFNFTAANMVIVEDSIGQILQSNWTWDSPSAANPWADFAANATVGEWVLHNCTIYRTTRGSAAAYGIKIPSGSAVKRLVVDGFHIADEAGQSFTAAAQFIEVAGTLTELFIASLDPTKITALVGASGFANITTIAGPGVLGTGFQIPDAKMSDNWLYISATGANAGKPCIKLAGVVTPI